MAQFVVQLRFDLDQVDRRMAARPAHREYLAALKAEGKLVAAGPFTDQTGALLVYDVADEAELREILAKDPYPDDVYEIATLAEWQPLFPFS
ncbi:muconolactone Delta-isomerase family protein [Kribbella sp. NPDC048915]|uniref:YciI family protein n=1 Tax=Kribbella sp. NPDC048915 TaxID=3155148 RepID=UPI0033E3FC89